MNCYFCLNGIDHNININNNNELLALKGASSKTTTITSKTPKSIALSSTEADLIRNAINIAGFRYKKPSSISTTRRDHKKTYRSILYFITNNNNENNENNNDSELKTGSHRSHREDSDSEKKDFMSIDHLAKVKDQQEE